VAFKELTSFLQKKEFPLEKTWNYCEKFRILYINSLVACVRASVEVLKPSVRLSRSWNPGPESWEPNIDVLKPRSWINGPETQVLRAKCKVEHGVLWGLLWTPSFFPVPCHALQARADCVRPSRDPLILFKDKMVVTSK